MKRYHLILDMKCRSFPRDKEDQRQLIESFLFELVRSIDMSIIAGPTTVYGDGSVPGSQKGWSTAAIIDFSSVTIHHFADDNEIKLDVFSCKPFTYQLAVALALKTFNGPITTEMYLTL